MKNSLIRIICACLLCEKFYVNAFDRKLEPIDPNKSPYEILELTSEAEFKDIRKAFRRLSLKYHPDKNPGDKIADANFKLVNSAYDQIGDESTREAFDSYAGQTWHNANDYKRARRSGKVKGGGDLYKSGIVESLDALSSKEMKDKVYHDGVVLLVNFFAGWCGHCQKMVPEYKKLASLLEDSVVVAAVNCEKNDDLCEEHYVNSYPTLKLWTRKQGIEGEVYEGENNAFAIQRWINLRLTTEYTRFGSEEEFEEKIRKNRTRPWLINWTTTAFRCPPCIGINGVLRDISSSLYGLVNVGEVDCKILGQVCADMGIHGYPILKLYPKNVLSTTVDLDYKMINMWRFPQVGVLRLFDLVSKSLLDHILIAQRRKELPQKLENLLRYTGDLDRLEEIPTLMKEWDGAEQRLWDNMLDDYELTEDVYELEILPFIKELEKETTCKNENDESCH